MKFTDDSDAESAIRRVEVNISWSIVHLRLVAESRRSRKSWRFHFGPAVVTSYPRLQRPRASNETLLLLFLAPTFGAREAGGAAALARHDLLPSFGYPHPRIDDAMRRIGLSP